MMPVLDQERNITYMRISFTWDLGDPVSKHGV